MIFILSKPVLYVEHTQQTSVKEKMMSQLTSIKDKLLSQLTSIKDKLSQQTDM